MNKDISILVVEDDPAFRNLIDDCLSRDRFTVHTAERVVGALDLMDDADILIVDLGLPNGSGRTLLGHWNRGKKNNRPSIVITGGTITKEDLDLLLRDAWNVLGKPFGVSLLGAVVDRYANCVRGLRAFGEIASLRRKIAFLTIIVAALGGYEILLPLFRSFF